MGWVNRIGGLTNVSKRFIYWLCDRDLLYGVLLEFNMIKPQYDEKDLFDLNLAAQELVGRTIVSCQVKPISEDYDDIPYLEMGLSDGTAVTISSYYGGYSGSSEDEYTRYIGISKEGI